MLKNNTISSTSANLENFIEKQKKLSPFEKTMEAGALIEETKTIDVDKAYKNISLRILKSSNTGNLFLMLTRVAAVLFFPLLLVSLWSLFLREQPVKYAENELTWHEIQSPAGMRSRVILPDGSRLWLNSESTIRYSIPFIRENRTIDLTGEAYLEVEKNEKSPFLLKSEKATVEVLGTRFNVKAYTGEESLEVSLAEGSIKLTFTNEKQQQKYLQMKPGEHVIYNKSEETVQMDHTSVEKNIAWRNNILLFDETPMEEVDRLLERWYGVNVKLTDPALKKYRFTTTFENESLYQVLELLKLSSPITIKYIPGKLNKQTGNTERANVIISKK